MFARLAQVEAKISSKIGMDFFQTHPSSTSRVEVTDPSFRIKAAANKCSQKLEQILPEAYTILAANPECAAIRDQLQGFKETTRDGHGATEEFLMG